MFLPGAGGSAEFWAPVASRLPETYRMTLLNWPGAGNEPHDPDIRGYEDLIDRTVRQLDRPTDLIAQSMGGIIALGIALRHPDLVSRLVLTATSGGIDVATLGAEDWRDEYRKEFPNAASWVTEDRVDHTNAVPRIVAPTLLIWGDRDPVSPLPVGQRLAALIVDSELKVVATTTETHSFAYDHPDEVASLITTHLDA